MSRYYMDAFRIPSIIVIVLPDERFACLDTLETVSLLTPSVLREKHPGLF